MERWVNEGGWEGAVYSPIRTPIRIFCSAYQPKFTASRVVWVRSLSSTYFQTSDRCSDLLRGFFWAFPSKRRVLGRQHCTRKDSRRRSARRGGRRLNARLQCYDNKTMSLSTAEVLGEGLDSKMRVRLNTHLLQRASTRLGMNHLQSDKFCRISLFRRELKEFRVILSNEYNTSSSLIENKSPVPLTQIMKGAAECKNHAIQMNGKSNYTYLQRIVMVCFFPTKWKFRALILQKLCEYYSTLGQ